MTLIVSLNGPDNVGKSTQIRILPEGITKLGSIRLQEASSQWWFKDCPTREFTKIIAEAFHERDCRSAGDITVLDRGAIIFKAVCIATAMVKDGSSLSDAWSTVNGFFDSIQGEDVAVFLDYGTPTESSIKILSKRDDHNWDETYLSYQIKLREAIAFLIYQKGEPLLRKTEIVRINCNEKSVVEVQNEIRSALRAYLEQNNHAELGKQFHPVLETVNRIVGLGGMSESGKSFSGHYAYTHHNFIRMKIAYFDQIAALTHSCKSIYHYSHVERAEFLLKEIERFSRAHYYFPYISVESLRDAKVTKYLKELLGAKFVIIYLDVAEGTRYERGSFAEKEAFFKKESEKKSTGANCIKDFADYIILNSDTLDELKSSLDKILQAVK